MRVALRIGREAVRDHEGGAALHHLVERGLHLALGCGVERARRLVEDQDRRILQQRARDREALALAAGERAAALADGASKPSGWRSMNSSACARAQASRISSIGRVRLADAQVLGDRAVEQQRFLIDHADVVAQRGELERADVHAVDLDGAGLRIEGAMQQRERGRFAGAGRADQRDRFARQHREAEIG